MAGSCPALNSGVLPSSFGPPVSQPLRLDFHEGRHPCAIPLRHIQVDACRTTKKAMEEIIVRNLKTLGVLGVVMLLSALVAGCSSGNTAAARADIEMAPHSAMPPEVQQAPATVRESYQFAIANPEVLQEIPCYCGCGAMGHTSNYSCYAEGTEPAGDLRFDNHALGCSICVDITQDTMRLMKEGKPLTEIRAYVDQRYSKYGPPTP